MKEIHFKTDERAVFSNTASVTSALTSLSGVSQVQIGEKDRTVHITYDPNSVTEASLKDVMEEMGLPVSSAK